MNSVTGIASDILSGLYDPQDLNTYTTEYWVRNNLGDLNIAVHANYALSGSGDSQIITGDSPVWDDRVGDIYKKMHEISYYRKQIMSILPAGSNNQVLELNSDGARIKLVNKSEIAKTYRSLKKDAEEELADMISTFNMSQCGPSQIAGDDIFVAYSNISSNYNRTN